ncbi:MAG: hypothetical protein HONBIEJF_02842 [Fimbriimonadaceae bacterium]|nr:hypothetical protein [Fimbriimonadaceae bacterium]
MTARKLSFIALGVAFCGVAQAQVPDMLSAFDAGGRAMGYGGGSYVSGSDSFSTYYNPAGLGWLDGSVFGFAIRNLPETESKLSGRRQDPSQDTEESSGAMSATHVGGAIKLRGGAVGFSYTTGGYLRDQQTADQLTDAGTRITDFRNLNHVKTDFLSLVYGTRLGASGWAAGAGIVQARNYVRNRGTGNILDNQNNQIGFINIDNSETATGIGFIVGLQFVPPSAPNTVFGISFRSPITTDASPAIDAYYDRIPGRLSFGAAHRRDGLRGGRDFMLLSLQADAFFGGKGNTLISRKNHMALGGGVEYNYLFNEYRIPIRVGFRAVPSGGDQFAARNAITFGLGVRPPNSNISVDLNFAAPTGGGKPDVALSLTFRGK